MPNYYGVVTYHRNLIDSHLLPNHETLIKSQNLRGGFVKISGHVYLFYEIDVDFVASGGIPTRSHGARLVGNFVGISLAFRFVKIGLELRSGPHGIWWFVMGFHTHMSLDLS
jgi:hypothetical protein